MICDKIVVFFIVFVIQQPYVAKIPHLYSACQVFQGFFAYATANIFFASANFIFAGACGNFALRIGWGARQEWVCGWVEKIKACWMHALIDVILRLQSRNSRDACP